ncbi:MAG: hypothetical protein WD770_07270 [Actinomycetota bacterium]
MRAPHHFEPDAEVGPEDRIRLDELLKELDQPEDRPERQSR